jgi:preprotein translocase subunit YajC
VNTIIEFFMAPSVAYAMARPGGGEESNFLFSLAPFFLVFAIIYFLMIRPQQTKQKEHQAMLNALKEGDSVVASGILGEVTKIKDDVVTVKVADNMRLRVLRSAITNLTAQETGEEKAKPSE